MIVLPPSAFSPDNRWRAIARDQARIVDAAVLEEAVVFRGEHRVDHLVRDRVERERDAPLLAELRDQLAVAAVHAQRHLQPNVLDGRDVGQRRAADTDRRPSSAEDGPPTTIKPSASRSRSGDER